jgi:hypothetical protein
MIPGSANPLLLATADAGGYTISRSVRLNASDSAYLSRTPASAGNRKTWTWAGWVKRSNLTDQQAFWSAGNTGTNRTSVLFDGSARIRFFNYAGSVDVDLVTTPVYRDASAWYHTVIAVDTTQGTASNRIKLYVNGVQVTTFSTSTYPSSSQDLVFNSAIAHGIGRGEQSGGEYFSGYLADIHFIDGQALLPTSFGEFSATTGVWMPKQFTGSYGTNGFKLDFADNSAATAAALGKDTSGNGNNWTPTNLSVTAGAGNDSLIDVPVNGSQTDTGVGGEVRGNYCTWNPLSLGSFTLSNGNLEANVTADSHKALGTINVNEGGKWYAEMTIGSRTGTYQFVGIAQTSNAWGSFFLLYRNDGVRWADNGAQTGGWSSYTTGDVIGIAYDSTNKTATFYKNNVSQGSITTTSTGVLFFAVAGSSGGNHNYTANFGARSFAYTAPSGFKALCTANLPAPTIVKPSTVMDVVLYTGTGSTLTPTSSLGFSPDLVWIKSRSAATDNTLYDAVRGAQARLESNNTDTEVTSDNGLTAFNSAGFTLGTLAQVNTSTATYAAWTWDESVSAGFDIVTYTGNATNRTISHSLGVAPQLIIVKQRTASSATNWAVWHTSLANTEYLLLNTTAAKATGATYWNSTSPTSSVFSLGTSTDVNANSGTYVAYCFAPVAGYSAFGSYTGNGSADGPFVYTGFRPRWVMIKASSRVGNWYILDTARSSSGGSNLVDARLYANTSEAENAGYGDSGNNIDILSNGFKLRSLQSPTNENNSTYVYAAFAESPFQYSRAR